MLKKLDQYIIKPFSGFIYFQRAVFIFMVNIVWIQLQFTGKGLSNWNCKILVLSECKRCQNGITTSRFFLVSIMTLEISWETL